MPSMSSLIGTSCIVMVQSIGPTSEKRSNPSTESAVAKVNGDEISLRMFRFMVRKYRSEVIQSFAPPALDAGFWATPIHGKIPAEVLKKRALEECIRFQVQLQLAQRHKLVDPTSFDSLMDQMAKENQRRAEALRLKQIVYGPSQFTEETFFLYQLSNLQLRLKEALGQRELSPTEHELKTIYEKDFAHLHRPDAIGIQRIYIPFIPSPQAARERLLETQRALKTGGDFEDLAYRMNPKQIPVEYFTGVSKGRKYPKLSPELLKKADGLQPGQTSEPIEFEGGFNILKCVSRKSFQKITYESVKNALQNKWVNQKYDAFVAQRVRSARVETVPELIHRLPIE